MAEEDNIQAVNREGLTDEELAQVPDDPSIGKVGTRQVEPKIVFDPAQREKIITHDDSHIILGGDRISSKASGYGGKGHTGAHMIDLIVGRDPKLSGNPSFRDDAARIYISQRSDLDNAFGLAAGHVGNFKGRAAIGVKADHVRVVARSGIKLVTMPRGTKNSLGKKTQTTLGIDLIAGNDDQGLEPIAKAYKVADTFEVIVKAIEKLSSMVEHFIDAQAMFNNAIATHTHVGGTGPVSPSPELAIVAPLSSTKVSALAKMPLRGHRILLVQARLNHLEPMADGWIGSRFNYSN